MGLRMLAEGEGGRDGVVEALHWDCAWPGSRAATRRPTWLLFPLQDAEWKARRQFGRLWCAGKGMLARLGKLWIQRAGEGGD
jgi:hypothetical protein